MRNCPACQRPVRQTEAACPFCAAALPTGGSIATAKRLAIGSMIVGAVSGCPAYGVPSPPMTAAPSASTSPSASPSAPLPAPVYGAPASPQQ